MKRFLLIATLLAFATPARGLDTAWVVTTDYSTFGRLRGVDGAAPWTVSADLATIPGDAVARHHDGLIYVLGRGGSNVLQVYTAAGALVREFSLGAGRNPQDIAFDSAGEAYVSCYDQAVLLRVDVANETVVATYPTSPWADADGLPETAWLTALDDKLYITCQNLDRDNWYQPAGPGRLLVFDMATETFGAPIVLAGADPYTQIEHVSGPGGTVRLRVGCAGVFGVNDGGIETVDPATGLSLGFDLTEAEIGGDVTAFATTGDCVIHAIVSDASFVTSLRRFDLCTDQMTVLRTAAGYDYADVAWDRGFQVFLADRTPTAPGLRVFDTRSGAQLTGGPLATGLPPFMVVLPEATDVSAVPLPARAGDVTLGAPFPNPCNPRAEVAIGGRPGAVLRLAVCDLRGHRLVSTSLRLDDAGRATWTFAGRDERGRHLPAGLYRVVVQGETGYAARSLTLLK